MFGKIENPYIFTDNEKKLIRENYSVHTDWDNNVGNVAKKGCWLA